MQTKLQRFKFSVLLITLINFLLSPICISIFQTSPALTVAVNFSLVIGSSILLTDKRSERLLSIILGIAALISIWVEYLSGHEDHIVSFRLIASFVLFSLVFYHLVKSFFNLNAINIDMIIGAMAGFILIGLIGGVFFEALDYIRPGSLTMEVEFSGYTYYYFSFISITSVGYGDIVPTSEAARALTVLFSLIGQFYLAVGIAVFVGKFLSHRTPNS